MGNKFDPSSVKGPQVGLSGTGKWSSTVGLNTSCFASLVAEVRQGLRVASDMPRIGIHT